MNLVEGFKKYNFQIHGCDISFTLRYIPNSEEVILFIHGLACSSDSFRNVFDKDYFPGKSLLLVDLPGYGESSKPDGFSYTTEETAIVIECLIKELPNFKIHVAAHSLGGAVALLFSDKFYEKVISFANIEGNLIGEDCSIFSRGVVDMPFQKYESVKFIQQKEEFAGHEQLRLEETTPSVVYKSAGSLVKWSDSGVLLQKFMSLTCKKVYFYGEQNIGMSILEKLEGIPTVMITNSGHAMMTENPEEFYLKLSLFICP